jgi:chitinase
MKLLRIFVLALLSAAVVLPWIRASAASADQKPMPKPLIVGYVFPDGTSLQSGQVDASALTRINYAFANIKNGAVVLGDPQDASNLALLTRLRKRNSALTILLSVGGWSWSGNFSDAALTEDSRHLFIASALDLIEHYDLDGLDVDWEYPDQSGAGNVHRREDKQNFTLLLKGLREQFDAASKTLHRRLYLTIAAEASDEYLQKTEMDKVQSYVDAVNLMAYDFYMSGPDHITGNSAPLFTSPADPKHASADGSVQAYEKAGVPAAKIVLGVPFYGYAWRDVGDENHGLFQRGKAGQDAHLSYEAISTTMLNHGLTRYWDAASSVPYLYSPEQRVFVSYEDPQSLAAKCQYVLKNKLAGLMFWHYSSDPSGTLLRAIDDALRPSHP